MPETVEDAPLTEVWVTEKGKRYRAYRGRVSQHIEWKINYHLKLGNNPQVVLISPEADKK